MVALDSSGWGSHLGVAVVLAIGVAALGLQFSHALQEEENLRTFLLGILIPAVFSVGILAGGLWLARSDLPGTRRLRVAGWTVGFGGLLAAAGVSIFLYQRYEGVELSHPVYVVANVGIVGAAAGFVVGVYDAQRRLVADRLAEERERANRLNQRLTVLNRVLRHDLRNGVNVIYAYADLLVERLDDDDARVIRKHVLDLLELTETARTVERTLRDDREWGRLDLVPVVETAVSEAREAHPAVAIETELPGTCHVHAIPEVEVAIENVVDNAVRHNDAEEPEVEVSLETVQDDGDEFAQLQVVDNGPGLPDTELEVFDRGLETPLEHSFGIGLWSTNWIVEAVGGSVQIERAEPTGTVVVVRLPVGEDESTGSTA